jgi:hypothetical protein
MPPTSSKPLPEERPPGIRKRNLAPILADPNNVDAAAIKRRKLDAILRQQCQPSIEIILDDPITHHLRTTHPERLQPSSRQTAVMMRVWVMLVYLLMEVRCQ